MRRFKVAPSLIVSFVLACVVLVTYAPALQAGFRLVDDYSNLHRAGTVPLAQYLIDSWDPRLQFVNYRPVGILLLLIAYTLFRAEPSYYHLIQISIHLASSLFLLGIVWRLSRNWRMAFLTAVFFASFPVASEAVFWISEQSPLATLCSLAAVFFWIGYLQGKHMRDHFIAMGMLVLALLSRESALAVPVAFFLIDRFIVCEPIDWRGFVRRYLGIGLILLIYVGIQYNIQQRGLYITVGGYRFGEHVLANYASYWGMLLFPWTYKGSLLNDWLAGILVVSLFAFAVFRRNAIGLSLFLMTIAAIGPVVLAPLGTGARYLYLATVPLAIFWGVALNTIWQRWKFSWFNLGMSAFVVCLIGLNGYMTASAAADYKENLRQSRVPYRDIIRKHATYPPNTRIFLIDPPFNSIPDIAGMFFLRYGPTVSVWGNHQDGAAFTYGRLRAQPARLRDYANAYVYYFNDAKEPIEVRVDRHADTQSMPVLPIKFQVPIQLEGYEVTNTKLKRGQSFVLILYWRALGRIDKDYTVFVHVVSVNGEMITGHDSMPRGGREKTSEWNNDRFTVDGHVLLIPEDALPGKYYLEIGLYYLPTMQRVSILNQDGVPITDHLVIESFEITE